MAFISNVKLSPTKQPAPSTLWDLVVTYDATFSDAELTAGYVYRDGFVVWEEDDTSADDKLTGIVGIQDFKPSSITESRRMRHTIDGSVLNTEGGVWGAEEIYVVVRLRNLSLNIEWTKKSPVSTIDP